MALRFSSFVGSAPSSALVAIRVPLFHGVAVLWSVSRDPPFFYMTLLLCGRSVVIIGSLPHSDLQFPSTSGSPCGTSQCLLVFGSLVLSLHVFFWAGRARLLPAFSSLSVSPGCSSR